MPHAADSLASPRDFADRVAIVTGGADGMGRHLVQTLAGLGCDVFFADIQIDAGNTLAKELGPRAHFVPCDLRDPKAIERLVAAAGSHNGRGAIDYLVNNAAIDPRIALEQASAEEFDRMVATNLRPALLAARAAAPLLAAGKGKAIVNIGTTNWMIGLSDFTLYAAAKSGLVGLTRALARELGPRGVRVNMLSPGWIMTPRQLRDHVTPADQQALLDAQCVKFLLGPEHITPVTLFLLSSASAAMSGQNLIVDGGKLLQ
ncbi:MAG: SDR family NAD(P)-dependent oxidoreductase [Planctomycetota bacterium]|nr:SDR family NAD(P)-dependent oxidoreductase [Planctomycetota bacterium]